MMDVFPNFVQQDETVDFAPNRAAGLRRLEKFLARTGRHYASKRNYDFGPIRRNNVSALSPWLRHRLITEREVLVRVLSTQGSYKTDKFIQEVFWRTYFKGWFEQHPSVWRAYQKELLGALQELESDIGLRSRYRDAVSGATGIDCFDHWANELATTGYLHNHARMWMASIWIFTLRLPWQLGADFFMRHLLDGDPASNTLSWRWVAGLHTKGKTYLARADNIAKYTEGRFSPNGLAKVAEPLSEQADHPRVMFPPCWAEITEPYILLLTEDDLQGVNLMPFTPEGVVGLLATQGRTPGTVGPAVSAFTRDAMQAVMAPLGGSVQMTDEWCEPLIETADRFGVKIIATAYPPIGPARSRLDKAESQINAAGISLCRVQRRYDSISWPHAKAGFFGLKKKIPTILRDLNLAN